MKLTGKQISHLKKMVNPRITFARPTRILGGVKNPTWNYAENRSYTKKEYRKKVIAARIKRILNPISRFRLGGR